MAKRTEFRFCRENVAVNRRGQLVVGGRVKVEKAGLLVLYRKVGHALGYTVDDERPPSLSDAHSGTEFKMPHIDTVGQLHPGCGYRITDGNDEKAEIVVVYRSLALARVYYVEQGVSYAQMFRAGSMISDVVLTHTHANLGLVGVHGVYVFPDRSFRVGCTDVPRRSMLRAWKKVGEALGYEFVPSGRTWR